MPQPRRVPPPFAQRETAWLWVPYRWTSGISMAMFSAPVLLYALHNISSGRGGTVGLVLWIVFGFGALVMICGGVMTAMRHGPALTADESGITVTCTGMDRSRIPWHMISGVMITGTKKSNKALVILTPDPEAWFPLADPMMVSTIRKMNAKHKVSGAIWILPRTVRKPIEVLAREIVELLTIQREEESAAAGTFGTDDYDEADEHPGSDRPAPQPSWPI